MRRRVLPVVLAIGGLAVQGCVLSRQPVTPLGGAVKVTPTPTARARERGGELLAVSADSLWLAADSEVVGVSWTQVERVQVRLSNLSAVQAMGYSAVLGLVTGGALLGACSQVEDADCGAVLPVVLASWLVWGALSAPGIESSANASFSGASWDQLRPYARFPQGLPDSLPRRALAAPRP